jgi:hypothetical protein
MDGPQRRFYVVEKRKIPDELSRKLHWFRWEAGTTWLSGMALLIIVFYMGGGALVDSDVCDISINAAIALGVGVLIVGWIVYDLLMLSPVGKSEKLFAGIAYLFIVGTAYGLTRVLSGRAAYIHIGCDVWNDHGSECVDANSSGAEKDDCRDQRRSKAGRRALRSGKATFQAEHVYGSPAGLHHDQQSFSGKRNTRFSLVGSMYSDSSRLDRREVH